MLVAYVTPETVDESALMAAAHDKLPTYMTPSAIVKLAELPRLVSGKVHLVIDGFDNTDPSILPLLFTSCKSLNLFLFNLLHLSAVAHTFDDIA